VRRIVHASTCVALRPRAPWTDAYICDAILTPFGRYGGALASVRADDLAAIPIAALVARNAKVDWGTLDDVIFGCANQAGEDNRNVAHGCYSQACQRSSRRHRQPTLRLQHGRRSQRRPRHQERRKQTSSSPAAWKICRARLRSGKADAAFLALDAIGNTTIGGASSTAHERNVRHGFHAEPAKS